MLDVCGTQGSIQSQINKRCLCWQMKQKPESRVGEIQGQRGVIGGRKRKYDLCLFTIKGFKNLNEFICAWVTHILHRKWHKLVTNKHWKHLTSGTCCRRGQLFSSTCTNIAGARLILLLVPTAWLRPLVTWLHCPLQAMGATLNAQAAALDVHDKLFSKRSSGTRGFSSAAQRPSINQLTVKPRS